MTQKIITLGLKYKIEENEKDYCLKKIHTDLLEYLDDAGRTYPNLYRDIVNLKYTEIGNPHIYKIIKNLVEATKACIGYEIPFQSILALDIIKKKPLVINDFEIIDFDYDVNAKSLIIDTILTFEELFLIDKYSDKLLVTEVSNAGNSNSPMNTYSIKDSDNLAILALR